MIGGAPLSETCFLSRIMRVSLTAPGTSLVPSVLDLVPDAPHVAADNPDELIRDIRDKRRSNRVLPTICHEADTDEAKDHRPVGGLRYCRQCAVLNVHFRWIVKTPMPLPGKNEGRSAIPCAQGCMTLPSLRDELRRFLIPSSFRPRRRRQPHDGKRPQLLRRHRQRSQRLCRCHPVARRDRIAACDVASAI